MLPPVYFFAAIVLMAALHLLVPVAQLLAVPWSYLGAGLILIGGALNVVCSNMFGRHETTIKPFEEPTVLIAEGPFKYSRNPMYLGGVLILIGIATLLGTLTPFLVLPLFVWTITTKFIAAEEEAMETRFGQDYVEYKRRVRRWL